MEDESSAFDNQIIERVNNGHIPDLRKSGRCNYFYNNVWRDQKLANLYYGEILNRILGLIKHIKNKKNYKILEVGCGPGHMCLELARNGFNVTGLDVSTECIQVANKTSKDDSIVISAKGKLNYIVKNFFDHKDHYDLILFTASLHHFPECKCAVEHSWNLLNKKGYIFVDEPVRDQVEKKNIGVLVLIESLLSITDSYYKNKRIANTNEELMEDIEKKYLQEIYETQDGSKVQSINDNEADYKSMHAALTFKFKVIKDELNYALYHQLIGGVRLSSKEKEYQFAKFMKLIDSFLCKNESINPTNFNFIGMK